jgi:Uma2 family endonuclease
MRTANAALSANHYPFGHRKRWTVEHCRKLESMGFLEAGRYELIDGEIVEKVGQDLVHSIATKKIFLALTHAFGADHVLMPVSVAIDDTNNPEPDVCVTQLRDVDYLSQGGVTISDLRLVVEVSDTTVWCDRDTKMHMYAAANVPEYWVLDLGARRLCIHRSPSPDGYTTVQEVDETQGIIPLAAPNYVVRMSDLLYEQGSVGFAPGPGSYYFLNYLSHASRRAATKSSSFRWG